jgi:hypothetical protein
MMHLIRVFFSLPRLHRMVLPRVFGLVVLVRIALWVIPYRIVRRCLDGMIRVSPSVDPSEEDKRRWNAIIWSVDAVSKRLLRKKPCLVQAHVAHWFLARAGCDTAIKIGVAMNSGEFKAHAWLEKDGKILLGGRDSLDRYAPLVPIRAGSSAMTY